MCETEYIERNALLERLNKRLDNLRKRCGFYDHYADGYAECVGEIVDALAADMVRVVRCKDCKWYRPYDKPVEDFDGLCLVRGETDEMEYCSYGDRKDEGV